MHSLNLKAADQALLFGQASTVLAGAQVQAGGQTFVPDDFTAYVDCEFAHSLPVVTAYGQAMLPQVVARSYASMLHKGVNIEHTLRYFDKEANYRDRACGMVIASEFPPEPRGGWIIPSTRAAAPGIRAILGLDKKADGMHRIIGEHQGGRHKWTVSMEVRWYPEETAVAWLRGSATGLPPNLPVKQLNGGWDAVRWEQAPEDLRALWSDKKRRFSGDWHGARPVQLLGGWEHKVTFMGIALVPVGAEAEAEINALLAAAPDYEGRPAAVDRRAADALRRLAVATRNLGTAFPG